jgi:DNA-binding MarR family transcriptional regulator
LAILADREPSPPPQTVAPQALIESFAPGLTGKSFGKTGKQKAETGDFTADRVILKLITHRKFHFENPMKARPSKVHARSETEEKSSENIASRLKLDKGLGFLVRLLDTRVNVLYEQLTAQIDITPRQFGVLLTLYQQGTLTLTELAKHIRVDRSTLGEMINRMVERSLINKRNNGNDRRSAEVLLAPAGRNALLKIVAGAAQLQTALLAPLATEDRAHFMRCMKLIAEPEQPASLNHDG